MIRFKSISADGILRLFCAALMLSLGFAHKPVFAAPVATFDEAYRLPDGSFAEMCSEHGSSNVSPQNEHKHSGDAVLFCDACLLSSSILIPSPDTASWLRSEQGSIENALVQRRVVLALTNVGTNHARGPPRAFV